MILKPEPLLPETFAPFGTIIETEGAERRVVNGGNATRYHRLAVVDAGDDGSTIISIFRTQRWPSRSLTRLERHPLSTQAFVPLSARDWLVVVAPGERPTAKDCRLFLAFGDQGVQYARNVWHHPLLVIEPTQEFVVIDRDGPGENFEEIVLDPPAELPGR